MRKDLLSKTLVMGVVVLFIGVGLAPSINANISRLPTKSKLVETSVRIHRANGITPYTVKLTEKESDEIDRIFDNLKVSLDSALSDKEIDEIYDDAVESLYELGLFPRHMTIKEAKQLVKGKSVKSSSVNLGTADENFNCKIAGRTTVTWMFDLPYPLLDSILAFFRIGGAGTDITWTGWNFPYFYGKIGSFSFGELEVDVWYHVSWYYPSKGWVWTYGSNGVVGWIGSFYGAFESIQVQEMFDFGYYDKYIYIWD